MISPLFTLDTNAITTLLQGNQLIAEKLKGSSWVGVSVISPIEFLANQELIQLILQTRQRYKLKLPDAIIASKALYFKAILITNDADFNHIAKLKLLTF